METTDNRAVSTPQTPALEVVSGGLSDEVLPVNVPGLTVLSPEELKARESEAAGEATPEEAQAAIAKVMEDIKAREEALRAQLQQIGSFVLIRFEHQNSINAVLQTSEAAPSRSAMIAVFRAVVRELEGYDLADYLAVAKRKQESAVALPSAEEQVQLNREERRFLAQISKKLGR